MRVGAEEDVCEEGGRESDLVTERELAEDSEDEACEGGQVLLRSGGCTRRGHRVVGVDMEK